MARAGRNFGFLASILVGMVLLGAAPVAAAPHAEPRPSKSTHEKSRAPEPKPSTGWMKPITARPDTARPARPSTTPGPSTPPRKSTGKQRSVGVFASPSPGQGAPLDDGSPVITGIGEANGTLAVTWTEPYPTDPADKYDVTLDGATAAAPCNYVAWVTGKSTYSCTTAGLTNGRTYKVTVRTWFSGSYVESQIWYATPTTTAPAAPTLNTPTVSGTTVTVTWAAPADTGGSPVTGYSVENLDGGSAGPACTPSPATNTTCTFTGTPGKTYALRVRATNAVGTGSYSSGQNAVVPATAPDAPTLNAPTVSGTTVTVTWVAPANNGGAAVTGYNVENLVGGSNGPACTPSGTAVTCAFTGVRGTTYTVRVRAVNAAGAGAYSTSRTVTVPAAAPGAPSLNVPTVSGTTVTATWGAAAANGAAVTAYSVENLESGVAGPACTPSPVTALTCSFTGVRGKTYLMRVRATNSAGTGSYSTQRSITVPTAAPDAPVLNVPTLSDETVTVTWSTPATNGSAITGYLIDNVDAQAAPGPACAPSPSTSTTCSFIGVRGKTYTLRVRATNGSGTSVYSNSQSIAVPAAAPDAPVLNPLAVDGTTVTATWSAPDGNGAPVTGYTVDNPGGPACTPSGTTCSFTGTPGQTYTVRVRATNVAGSGAYSATQSVRLPWPVTAPSGVTVRPYGGALLVGWTMADTAGVTGFTVTATGSGSSGTCTAPAANRGCRVDGLTNGVAHTVRVTALATAGRDPSYTDSAGTPSPLPLPVVTLTRGVRNIVVAWTFPAEEQPRITGFTVTAGGSVACAPQPAVDARSCTLTGLADATSYTVTVTALAASGAAADNAAGSASAATAGTADAPTLAQPTTQDTTITASWTPGADNGSYATSYEVEVLRAEASMPGPASLTCAVSGTSCTATGTRGATYTVRVRAVNMVGPSAWSQPASVVVAAVAPAAPVLADLTREGTLVSAAWAPGADNGAAVTAYTVTVTGSGGDAPTCAPAPATATTCRFTGVRGGTYIAHVTATNAAGTSPAGNPKQIALPAAVPTPAVTVRPGSGAVVVTWDYPAADESRISAFTVVTQPGGRACQTALTPSSRGCRIDGLQNGTAYTATVTAVATGGDRADDVTAQGTATPVTLAVTAVTVAGPGTLTVRWQFPAGDESRITGFRVTAGGTACVPDLLDVTARTCRITGLTDGTEYTVTVRGVSPTGDDRDDAVSTATAVPSPLPLTGPQIERGDGALTVSWTYPTEREGLITGFRVTAGSFSCGQLAPTARSCVLDGLTNGTLYTVTVVAVAGSGFPDDNAWGSASGRPSAGAPGAPTAVTVAPGDATATVGWTAPTGAGQGIAGYRVSARSETGGSPVVCSTDALTCAVTPLTNGVTYRITVTTVGVDGDSPASEPAVVTPAAPAQLPPTVPTAANGTMASASGVAFPAAGRETVLTGTGFAPNTTVTLAIYSAPTPLGTVVTDDQGTFRRSVTIPAGFAGKHTLVSIGLDPSGVVRVLSLGVSVGSPPSPSSSADGGLAITGLPVLFLVMTGLGLVAAGAATRVLASLR